MKANKLLKTLAASAMSLALLAGVTVMPAMAAVDPATGVTFTKTINMTTATGATVPNATYNYSIGPGDGVAATADSPEILAGNDEAVTGAPTITSSVTFASADEIGVESKVAKSVTVDFSDVAFAHAGIYRYVITESDPTVAGLNTDGANTIYLDVYVVNSGDVREIAHYIMTTSDAAPTYDENKVPTYATGSKFSGDEDAYTTYSLTVTKNIEGTMADKTATFSIDVDFTNLSNGTKVTVDGAQSDAAAGQALSVNKSLGDNVSMTITGVPADAVYTVVENLSSNEGYTVTYKADNGEENRATYDNGAYTTVNAQNMNAANRNVTVINTKTATTPTGIVMNIAPYALMVVIAVAGVAVFMRKRVED